MSNVECGCKFLKVQKELKMEMKWNLCLCCETWTHCNRKYKKKPLREKNGKFIWRWRFRSGNGVIGGELWSVHEVGRTYDNLGYYDS